jgi:trehalose 6-phosphate synthase
VQDERLYAIAFCDLQGQVVYSTSTYPEALGCTEVRGTGPDAHVLRQFPPAPLHVTWFAVPARGEPLGKLVLVHDMSFVDRRSADTPRYLIGFFILLGIIVSFITVLIAQLSWRGWMYGVRAMLRGEGIITAVLPASDPDLQPLVGEVRALLRKSTRAGATWSAARSGIPTCCARCCERAGRRRGAARVEPRAVHPHAQGRRHRDPAPGERSRHGDGADHARCSGTWIAHGSGTADRATVDAHDRIDVPPGNPAYTLRRVWLTNEEERGYYYGFANEGLWPLCHIAHVRPVFRTGDFEQYARVNERFAEALCSEAKTDDPIVLVQDYHFALLPRYISERLPKATIITFWHIPLAQSGVIRHLSLANTAAGGPARQHDPRLPHAIPLPQLHRHGRPLSRGEDRVRELHGVARRSSHEHRAVPDFHPVAVAMGRAPADGRRVPSPGVRA